MEKATVARTPSISVEVGAERSRASVRFTLGTAAAKAEAARLDVVHALGVTTGVVPADAEGVALDLSALPAGPAELRVTPLLPGGREGRAASTSFAVPGRAGTGPELALLQVRDRRLRRPGKGSAVAPRLRVAVREGRAAASAVHVRLERPDGSVEHALQAAPAGDAGELRPFELAAGAPAGKYVVTAVAVDVDGNTGPAAETTFALGDEGAAAPEIGRVTWRKDDRIVIRGSGFAADGLVVLLDGLRLPVAAASDGELEVLAPTTVPGRLEVLTDLGSAVAPREVGPPVRIEIVPPDAAVHEGGALQLAATVRGAADATIAWSVDPAASVAISEDGLLTVGAEAPDAVVVRAASPSTGAEATATVRVVGASGRDVALGPRGGTSRGVGGATLTVPPGALAAPVQMTVSARPPRAARKGAVVAAEVGLTAAKLAKPATLEVPLRVAVTPGAKLEVEHLEGGKWTPAGHGTVDVTGYVLHVDLSRLTEWVRVLVPYPEPYDAALSAAPAIHAVQRTPVEEGDTVALLVTGENLVPGLTQVSVARGNGTVDQRIACRGVVVRGDGSALGVTVEVGALGELGEGMLSDHVLRADTPAGRAEIALPILGHDELVVTAGQTTTVTASRVFSRLQVDTGGTLLIASTVPPVTIAALGDAVIDGDVTVVAGAGASGARGVDGGGAGAGGGGAAPFSVGVGGAGGAGGGNGSTAGSPGTMGGSPGPGAVGGTGGAGGPGGGGGLHPHLGGDGVKGGTAPHTRIPGFQARSSLVPPLRPGAGGGGGGGGGGEGWAFTFTGGGGGGGGAGGGAAAIGAGEGIRLRGVVMANGGDAGNGGSAGADPPGVFTYISAGQGGGGGGGGGGSLWLQGVGDSWGAFVLAVSGKPGATPSATVQVEARTLLQQALARPSSGEIRADGAIIGLARPVATQGPDVHYRPNLVETQASVDVSGFNATHMRVSNGFGTTRRAVTSSFNAGLNADTFACIAPIPLAEGFNDIIAEWMYETYGLPESSPLLDAQVLMTSAPVRMRTVLRMVGTIAQYGFSATIAPAAPQVATERSIDLTAAVNATQATPLLWSVSGGNDFGTVAPTAAGARYTAPTRPLAAPALVAVASALAPTFRSSVAVTVLPGIATAAVAATGQPRIPTLPSANCGQVITIDIPAATFALTGQGFGIATTVEFPLLFAAPGGGCARSVQPVVPTIATGLQGLTAEVPGCADPGGWVRIAGHGSARLQIVPAVTRIDGDRAAELEYTIRGTGFACGETQVLVNGVPQPATAMVSLTCGSIVMRGWPPAGASLIVRTSGGDSAPIPVP